MIWFIWTGRGWVVPLTYFTVGFVIVSIQSAFEIDTEFSKGKVSSSGGFFLLAAALLYVGTRWTSLQGRLVWDARRERLTRLPAGHTFLWLDVKIWGWVFLVAGLAKLVGLT